MARLSRSLYLATFTTALVVTYSARSATLESSPTEANDSESAFASDQTTSSGPDALEVAREVLRLQEELGGSIVTDFSLPKKHSPGYFAPPPTRPQPTWTPRQPTPVDALRQTAWQLEQSAHLLESLDLYSQADALRTTATRLRQDARKMKTEMKQGDSAAVSAE